MLIDYPPKAFCDWTPMEDYYKFIEFKFYQASASKKRTRKVLFMHKNNPRYRLYNILMTRGYP